ncbi:hypothetical protein CHLRE_10g443400v5 [Chlamydomonas reinhardtii]|uniref:Protein kinase domain-containing protein n=1 Tax=Chlamydomonas reinhardtii TaxID=3055 RepID=A0A2K3DAN3_CHLRE|nr:uncharacterized protein CHLRE_10g443400v5 [Chlamydomonas reinhardtii]PNW77590.1 hypothetical protein CHLRE_10g443400v5 [Chlamydomonas reinhardtii]
MENSGEHHGVPWIPEGDELENDPPALAPFLLVDNPADPEATELGDFCDSMLLSMQHRLKVDAELSTFRQMTSLVSGQLVRLSMNQATYGAQPSGAAFPASGVISGFADPGAGGGGGSFMGPGAGAVASANSLTRHEKRLLGTFEASSRAISGSAGGPPRFQQPSITPDGSAGQSYLQHQHAMAAGGQGPANAGGGSAGRGMLSGRGNSSSQRRQRTRALLQYEGLAVAGRLSGQPLGGQSPISRPGYEVKNPTAQGTGVRHGQQSQQQGDRGSAGQLVSDEEMQAAEAGQPRDLTSWLDVLALPQQHHHRALEQGPDLVPVPTSDTALQVLSQQPSRQAHGAHANGHSASPAGALLGARPGAGSGVVGGSSALGEQSGPAMNGGVDGMNWEILPEHLAHLTPLHRQQLQLQQQQQLGASAPRSGGAGGTAARTAAAGAPAGGGVGSQPQDIGASLGMMGQVSVDMHHRLNLPAVGSLGPVGPGGLPPPPPLPPQVEQYLVLSDVSPPQFQTQPAGTPSTGVEPEVERGDMAWGGTAGWVASPGSSGLTPAAGSGVTGRQPRPVARHASVGTGISIASGRPLRPIPELAAALTSATESQLQAHLQGSAPLSQAQSQSHADAVAAMAATAAAVTASVTAATANSGSHAVGSGAAAGAHRARAQQQFPTQPQPISTLVQLRAMGRAARTPGASGGAGDALTGGSSGDVTGGSIANLGGDRSSKLRRKVLGRGAGAGHADAAHHALMAQGLTSRSASWYSGAPAAHADPNRVAPDRPVELRVCRTPRDLLDGIADLRPLEQPAEEEPEIQMEAGPGGVGSFGGNGVGSRTRSEVSGAALQRARRNSTSVGMEAGRPHWQRPSSAHGHAQQAPSTAVAAMAAAGEGAGGGGRAAAVGGWMAVTIAGSGAAGAGEAAAGAVATGRCRSIMLQGRWQGRPVAVKVVAGAGLDPRNGCLGAALTASAVIHSTLVRVYGVRLLPAGLAAVAGTAQGFGAAALGSGGAGVSGASALVLPPVARVVAAHARAASEALAALRPEAGEGVLVVVMELCGSGSLEPLTRAPLYSPFRPSRSWPAYLARRALLRTAMEVAGALGRLHACGTAHGGLRPRNLLRVAAADDRRNFCVKVSDASLSVSSLQLAAATCAQSAAARTHTRSDSIDRLGLGLVVVPAAPGLNRTLDGPPDGGASQLTSEAVSRMAHPGGPGSTAGSHYAAPPASNTPARLARVGSSGHSAGGSPAPSPSPARAQAWGTPQQAPTSGSVSHLVSPSMAAAAAAAAGLTVEAAAVLAAPEALLCPQLEDLLYVAPEAQLEPAACLNTAAADAYAFGVLLWSLATGEQLPPELALAEPAARTAKVRAVLAAAVARRQQQQQQQQQGLGLSRLSNTDGGERSSGRLQAPGLLAAPGWPAGPHGHLQPLYEWCVSPAPEERPTMDQVVAELRLLDEAVRSERPKSRAVAAAGYAAMTVTSLSGAGGARANSGGGGGGYPMSGYMG